MSYEAPTARSRQYADSVNLLAQQERSRLFKACSYGEYHGKAAKAVEQVGQVAAVKRTTRHGDTPLISTPHDARWVFPEHYEWADLIDHQDKLEINAELTNSYVKNGAAAMNRALDDTIIEAFFATAKVGEDGTENRAFDTSNQTVAVDTGAASGTGLNLAKLRAAKKILMAGEVDVERDPLFLAISAEQHDDLLNETQAVSLDFQTKPVLEGGLIMAFMGFTFIHTERLPVDGNDYRRCPAWSMSGMHVGTWNQIEARVEERSDKSFATQVYVRGTFGATRTEESKVVDILCAE